MYPKTASKRRPRQPSYRLHKARNCAVVTINGKNRYLGPYDSPRSHEEYARLIARWKVDGGKDLGANVSAPANGELTVNALILRYLDFATGYYVKHGQPTGEVNNICHAMAKLKELFGRTSAEEFGPPDLEIVQQAMIGPKLARTTINSRASRIKRMFRWASRKGLVPPATYHGLLAVEGLKRGRTAARETKRVPPVPDEIVMATLAHLNPYVRAMVQVHELAGLRSQDLCNMRTGDRSSTRQSIDCRPALAMQKISRACFRPSRSLSFLTTSSTRAWPKQDNASHIRFVSSGDCDSQKPAISSSTECLGRAWQSNSVPSTYSGEKESANHSFIDRPR